MKRKFRTEFGDSVVKRVNLYDFYFDKIKDLTLSLYDWKNLPAEIDERFLELMLFDRGTVCFTYDTDLERYVCLPMAGYGKFNIYHIPIMRRLFASNGYNVERDIDNSVLIFNNNLRTSSIQETKIFASRLANMDITIDVNISAQKTPVLIRCEESQRLTLLNAYMQYDGGQPVIFGDKTFSASPFECVKTDAPFVAPDIYELKVKTWNELLTYKGISNVSIEKKERLISDEVIRSQGGTYANRYSGLISRQRACKQINDMFGLDISVEFRQDQDTKPDEINDLPEGGEGNE